MATKQHIRFDWAMKRLLRQKANFEVLEGFLSELLKEDVVIQNIEEGEGNQTYKNDKFNRVDILALNSKNELVLIEIQTTNEIDYLLRMLYGVSKAIVDHIELGDAYIKVKKVYSINIVYFGLGQGNDYIYHGKFEFTGENLHDTLGLTNYQKKHLNYDTIAKLYPEFYILKVNNFDKQAVDTLDQWIYFLKNTTIPDNFNAKGLAKAKKTLEFDQMTDDERRKYKGYLSFVQSEQQQYLAETGESFYKGLDKGIGIGEEKGVEKAQKNFVLESHRLGLTVDTIATITKLNEELIGKIINEAGENVNN
jgi:predicted transposase/invertase (TIGR01784 family)